MPTNQQIQDWWNTLDEDGIREVYKHNCKQLKDMKNYYLSTLEINHPVVGITKIQQLVWASDKTQATIAIKMAALNDGVKEEEIMHIRIADTIIGE